MIFICFYLSDLGDETPQCAYLGSELELDTYETHPFHCWEIPVTGGYGTRVMNLMSFANDVHKVAT